MIKTLIADDDLNYAKYILNIILNHFKDINVSYIATDGEETLNAISSQQYDLVFLDLQMPKMNGIEIINKINKLNNITIPKFIIISGDISLINMAHQYNSILNIINKTDNCETMCKKIRPVIHELKFSNNLTNIKNEIISQLLKLGYNFKHKGTIYIMESILFIYEQNNVGLLDNLENNVWKYIAHRNNRTVLNVKTSMIKATNSICVTEKNYIVQNTPKSIISMILVRLFNNYN